MRSYRLAFAMAAFIAALVSFNGFALEGETAGETGDAAIAARYASWAIRAADEGRWQDAEAALERAADYSASSSDVSYLLALARLKLDRPAGAVLGALRRAIEADRWDRYGREAALLVEAGVLLRLRLFDEALGALETVGNGPEGAYLRSAIFAREPDIPRFRASLREALEAYPGDPRFVGLLFDRLEGRLPDDADRSLMDIALSRLPYLLELDPTLAYRASPFIRDLDMRRRLVAAYRAKAPANIASIPQALELGLVDETTAITELFAASSIDAAVYRSVWALLRNDPAREAFTAATIAYEGELVEDMDRDGYVETTVRYSGGQIVAYAFDADQDGLSELDIDFADGLPARGSVAISADARSPDIGLSGDSSERSQLPAFLSSESERRRASVEWARYPYLASVSFDGIRYLPAPASFPFAPVRLTPLIRNKEKPTLRFPKDDVSVSRLSVRSLVSFASVVERPGTFFEGTLERIELVHGIPRRSTETIDGRVVSILEFSSGRPRLRKVDTDFDGRMETVRYYRTTAYAVDPSSALNWKESVELVESDWNGDGVAEYAERYFGDGSVERSWDMDGDGKRERVERSTAAAEDVHAIK